MSAAIESIGVSGDTYYDVVRTGATAWNGTAFVTEAETTRAAVARPVNETPADSGRFVGEAWTSIPAGERSVTRYRRVGSEAALTDVAVGGAVVYWSGTALSAAGQATTEALDALTKRPVIVRG